MVFLEEKPPDFTEKRKTLLHDIIRGLKNSKAFNDKDKVFGLHVIFKQLEVPVSIPDYTKSISEIYTELMLAILRTTSSLQFEHHWYSEHHNTDLPTWVPDLTVESESELTRPFLSEGVQLTPVVCPLHLSSVCRKEVNLLSRA
jgi:hypothetical protein